MLPAVIGAATAVSKLFGDQHPKDAERIRKNNIAFALASSAAGDRNAFNFLRARSGKFGQLTITPIPGIDDSGLLGGWASGGKGDEDAYAKYKQLAPRYEAMAANGSAGQLPTQIVDPTNQGKDQNTAALGQAPTSASMGMLLGGLVLIGVVAWALRKGS